MLPFTVLATAAAAFNCLALLVVIAALARKTQNASGIIAWHTLALTFMLGVSALFTAHAGFMPERTSIECWVQAVASGFASLASSMLAMSASGVMWWMTRPKTLLLGTDRARRHAAAILVQRILAVSYTVSVLAQVFTVFDQEVWPYSGFCSPGKTASGMLVRTSLVRLVMGIITLVFLSLGAANSCGRVQNMRASMSNARRAHLSTRKIHDDASDTGAGTKDTSGTPDAAGAPSGGARLGIAAGPAASVPRSSATGAESPRMGPRSALKQPRAASPSVAGGAGGRPAGPAPALWAGKARAGAGSAPSLVIPAHRAGAAPSAPAPYHGSADLSQRSHTGSSRGAWLPTTDSGVDGMTPLARHDDTVVMAARVRRRGASAGGSPLAGRRASRGPAAGSSHGGTGSASESSADPGQDVGLPGARSSADPRSSTSPTPADTRDPHHPVHTLGEGGRMTVTGRIGTDDDAPDRTQLLSVSGEVSGRGSSGGHTGSAGLPPQEALTGAASGADETPEPDFTVPEGVAGRGGALPSARPKLSGSSNLSSQTASSLQAGASDASPLTSPAHLRLARAPSSPASASVTVIPPWASLKLQQALTESSVANPAADVLEAWATDADPWEPTVATRRRGRRRSATPDAGFQVEEHVTGGVLAAAEAAAGIKPTVDPSSPLSVTARRAALHPRHLHEAVLRSLVLSGVDRPTRPGAGLTLRPRAVPESQLMQSGMTAASVPSNEVTSAANSTATTHQALEDVGLFSRDEDEDEEAEGGSHGDRCCSEVTDVCLCGRCGCEDEFRRSPVVVSGAVIAVMPLLGILNDLTIFALSDLNARLVEYPSYGYEEQALLPPAFRQVEPALRVRFLGRLLTLIVLAGILTADATTSRLVFSVILDFLGCQWGRVLCPTVARCFSCNKDAGGLLRIPRHTRAGRAAESCAAACRGGCCRPLCGEQGCLGATESSVEGGRSPGSDSLDDTATAGSRASTSRRRRSGRSSLGRALENPQQRPSLRSAGSFRSNAGSAGPGLLSPSLQRSGTGRSSFGGSAGGGASPMPSEGGTSDFGVGGGAVLPAAGPIRFVVTHTTPTAQRQDLGEVAGVTPREHRVAAGHTAHGTSRKWYLGMLGRDAEAASRVEASFTAPWHSPSVVRE